jgi:2-keto-4-pentenoate hydratase
MDHHAAAAFLLAARNGPLAAAFPPELVPQTEADAYEIQRLTIAALGEIGGWKVGAAGPDAPPTCAPMPGSGLHEAPATLHGADFTTRDVESEIAFVLAQDLPPRDTPYTRDEIVAAIGSCHPGIEVLQSRFADARQADQLSNLADLIRHGAYVTGTPIPGWEHIDFSHVTVTQAIGEDVQHARGNPAGDMMRLVQWLANTGAVWAGGLRAGQVITTGSWTGSTPAPEADHVISEFSVAAPVALGFA